MRLPIAVPGPVRTSVSALCLFIRRAFLSSGRPHGENDAHNTEHVRGLSTGRNESRIRLRVELRPADHPKRTRVAPGLAKDWRGLTRGLAVEPPVVDNAG